MYFVIYKQRNKFKTKALQTNSEQTNKCIFNFIPVPQNQIQTWTAKSSKSSYLLTVEGKQNSILRLGTRSD